MTKKEMAEAMLGGKTLVAPNGSIAYFDKESSPPFRWKGRGATDSASLISWEGAWTVKPEHKKRPMNLEEALSVLTSVALRPIGGGPDDWRAPWDKEFEHTPLRALEYAYIKEGKIGEPYAFEVEEGV